MTELWKAFLVAADRWHANKSPETENAMVDAYSAWCHSFVDDPLCAHEATELLRRKAAEAA